MSNQTSEGIQKTSYCRSNYRILKAIIALFFLLDCEIALNKACIDVLVVWFKFWPVEHDQMLYVCLVRTAQPISPFSCISLIGDA